MRIGDASTNRVVGMFRVPVLKDGAYEVSVPGMIEPGVTYAVEVYTDDGNGGGIRAFRFEQLASDAGLETSFSGANPGAQVNDAQPAK